MKLPFLNIWIETWDYKTGYDSCMECFYDQLCNKPKKTFTDKQGKLRYKHNGQFAPDNRTQFKKTHDELRASVDAKHVIDYTQAKDVWDAKKNEGFGA